jgi:hypothetical protein
LDMVTDVKDGGKSRRIGSASKYNNHNHNHNHI